MNEAPSPKRSPMTYVFFAAMWLVFGLVALVILAWGVENWRGEHAWQAALRDHAANGDPLEGPSAGPAHVPDDQNFLATPLLKPFFDYHLAKGAKGETMVVYNNAPAVERVKAIHLPDNQESPTRQRTGRTSLEGWQATLADTDGFPKPDQPGTPAKDILTALHRWDSELAELDAASRRPYSRVEAPIDERMDVMMPCIAYFKGAANLLKLRCTARLAAGDGDGAADDIEFIDRLAKTLSSDPVLIDELVSIAIRSIAMHALWEGLVDHRWNDAQLVRLQAVLAARDSRADMIRAFRGERSFGIQMLERAVHDPKKLAAAAGESGAQPSPIERMRMNSPRGWTRQNQVSIVVFHDELGKITGPWAKDELPTSKINVDPVEKALAKRPFIYSFQARMVVAAIAKGTLRTDRLVAATRMGIIACALERYRLANGEYPASLDRLTPRYLAALPLDPCTGGPFYYNATSDETWYRLYSTGPDGKDDGGDFNGRESGGDWLWPLPTETSKRLF
jgi:hypothetical protein